MQAVFYCETGGNALKKHTLSKQNLKNFLLEQSRIFEWSDFPSSQYFLKKCWELLLLMVVATAIIKGISLLSSYPNSLKYLSKAYEEGISVYFWNVVTSAGICCLGVMILFPVKQIRALTHWIFETANSTGMFMCSFITGQLIFQISSESTKSWIGVWGLGVGVFVFYVIFFVFFVFVWIASYVTASDAFLIKVRNVSLGLRALLSFCFFTPIVYFLLLG